MALIHEPGVEVQGVVEPPPQPAPNISHRPEHSRRFRRSTILAGGLAATGLALGLAFGHSDSGAQEENTDATTTTMGDQPAELDLTNDSPLDHITPFGESITKQDPTIFAQTAIDRYDAYFKGNLAALKRVRTTGQELAETDRRSYAGIRLSPDATFAWYYESIEGPFVVMVKGQVTVTERDGTEYKFGKEKLVVDGGWTPDGNPASNPPRDPSYIGRIKLLGPDQTPFGDDVVPASEAELNRYEEPAGTTEPIDGDDNTPNTIDDSPQITPDHPAELDDGPPPATGEIRESNNGAAWEWNGSNWKVLGGGA